jgi:hypothetical protein
MAIETTKIVFLTGNSTLTFNCLNSPSIPSGFASPAALSADAGSYLEY